MYESEFTKFLRELKERNPRIEEEQRRGRAIWWDKTPDAEREGRELESRVRQKPYVYQPD